MKAGQGVSNGDRGGCIVLGSLIFAYVIATGLFVQLVLFPHVFPHLHAGDGLLHGLDSTGFHATAVEMARNIVEQGWSAWTLRPDGHNSPPGIMAIFYSLLTPKPYVLLPLNGLVWAINACLWYRILHMLFPQIGRWAMAGAVLIALMPSTFAWTTQFLKDTFSITGSSFLIYAFVRAMMPGEAARPRAAFVLIVGAIVCGAALIWLVRPYLLQMIALASLSGLIVLILGAIARQAQWRQVLASSCVTLAIIACAVAGNQTTGEAGERMDVSTQLSELSETVAPPGPAGPAGSGSGSRPGKYAGEINIGPVPSENRTVAFLNGVANIILKFRKGYCNGSNLTAGSVIDCKPEVESAADAAWYLPRAIQLMLLAPFPVHWFADARSAGGSMMRLAAAGEMTFNYLVFALAVVTPFFARVRITLPMVVVIVLLLVPGLVIVYSNPNLGTIYRMRYLFLEGIVAIAACFVIAGWLARRRKSVTLNGPAAA